jgi:hypothetical protein
MIIVTVFETLLVGFTIWSIFNEDKFIRFEDKIKSKLFKKG